MASFVKDSQINFLLEELIAEAETHLVLFCPYFKLHDRLRDALKLRMNDPKLRIIIVFGKNEEDPSKSLNREDYEFLTQFPFIDIAYEKRLHAKYYANEKKGVITSLNLHTHSQNNNIEVGVLFESKGILKNFTSNTIGLVSAYISNTEDLAEEAHQHFIDIYENAEKIYQKQPVFKSGMLAWGKSYLHSEVILDRTEWFRKETTCSTKSTYSPIGFRSNSSRKQFIAEQHGFCIRTGERIELNSSRPLSYSAFQIWSEFNNPDYIENFCHNCGKPYRSSVRNPLCKKCTPQM